MIELKPCPFCGSPAQVERMKVRVHKCRAKSRRRMRTNVYYAIGCSGPDCILQITKQSARLIYVSSADGLNTMARRWNRRTES